MCKPFWTFVFYLLLIVIIGSAIGFGIMLIQGKSLPIWLQFQRNAVEDSKSFTDSNNTMLQKYIADYAKLDTKIAETKGDKALAGAYKAQQIAIIDAMCQEISTMKADTVRPSTKMWLSEKGNCQ
jgi:hypothetical protein